MKVPADDNLLSSLIQYTWTLDNIEGNREANAVYSKSVASKKEKSIKLKDILRKHGYEKGIDTTDDIKKNDIPDNIYTTKRKEFISKSM